MGSSETARDTPDIYKGDDIVRSYIERYKVLGGLFGYSLVYNSVKLFNKPIDFVQTHRYYSKKSTTTFWKGPKYKKEYKDHMKLSPFLKQALIGLILGDQREFSTLNSKSFRLTKLEQKKMFISPF